MADATDNHAWRAVQRYREQMIAGVSGGLSDLFAVDGVFHNRNGDEVRGREAIRGFLDTFLAGRTPVPMKLGETMIDGNRCWVEFHNASDDPQKVTTASHFQVDDDGLIVRLAVFNR